MCCTVHVGHCSEITLFLQQNGSSWSSRSEKAEGKRAPKEMEREVKIDFTKTLENLKEGCHTTAKELGC